eukprot:9126930-Prorocentrum_lima.AAC.1
MANRFRRVLVGGRDDIDTGFRLAFEELRSSNVETAIGIMNALKQSGARVVFIFGDCWDKRSLLLAASRLDMLEGY